MKSGYDQFFKKARQAAQAGTPPPPKRRQAVESPRPQASASDLTQELEKQLRQRAGVRPKKRKKVSWKMATLSFIGFVACIIAAVQYEKVEQFLQKFEVSLLGQAQAETKPTPEKKENPAKSSDGKSSDKAKESPETQKSDEKKTEASATGTEDVSHLQKLVDRKKQLDDREAELARTEEEIAKQKEEVEKRMKELEDMRGKISSILEDRVKIDEQKVDSLMQMYSNMKPPQAAKVFEAMDEDLAVEILGRMKKKNAAEILNLLKPEKAQVISEKYAGYRRQPASAKSEPTTTTNKEGKP